MLDISCSFFQTKIFRIPLWIWHAVLQTENLTSRLSNCESDMSSYKLIIWHAVFQLLICYVVLPTENLTCRLSKRESDMSSYKLRIRHAVLQTENLTCRLSNKSHLKLRLQSQVCKIESQKRKQRSFANFFILVIMSQNKPVFWIKLIFNNVWRIKWIFYDIFNKNIDSLFII